ncbi:hypothetical protein AAVH_42646, partial [Aphelenchoides avenae]
TATALLTTGYLGALAFLDWLAYNVPLTEVDRGLVSAASIKLILVVLTAQLGLFRERYALLVPLIVSQLIIGFILLVACGYVIVIQIAYACAHANVAGQVAALVAIEGGVIVIHGYAVLIVYRCMRYLKTREPQASEECSVNQSFLNNLLHSPFRALKTQTKDDDKVLLLETSPNKPIFGAGVMREPQQTSTPTEPKSPMMRNVLDSSRRLDFNYFDY